MQQIDKKGLDTLALNTESISQQIEGGKPMTEVSSRLPDVNEPKHLGMTGGQPSPG